MEDKALWLGLARPLFTLALMVLAVYPISRVIHALIPPGRFRTALYTETGSPIKMMLAVALVGGLYLFMFTLAQ